MRFPVKKNHCVYCDLANIEDANVVLFSLSGQSFVCLMFQSPGRHVFLSAVLFCLNVMFEFLGPGALLIRTANMPSGVCETNTQFCLTIEFEFLMLGSF